MCGVWVPEYNTNFHLDDSYLILWFLSKGEGCKNSDTYLLKQYNEQRGEEDGI